MALKEESITVQVTAELRAAVEALAERQDKPMAAVVRDAIKIHVAREALDAARKQITAP